MSSNLTVSGDSGPNNLPDEHQAGRSPDFENQRQMSKDTNTEPQRESSRHRIARIFFWQMSGVSLYSTIVAINQQNTHGAYISFFAMVVAFLAAQRMEWDRDRQ
jgi:hypothetical protein